MSLQRSVAVVSIAVVLVAFLTLRGRGSAPEVEVVAARRGELLVVVATNGVVEPVDELRVRARLDGRIVAIPEPGVRVEAGDELLRIDDAPVAAALAAARSDRLASLDSVREARDEHARVSRTAAIDQELFEQGALTPERRAKSRADLQKTRARVDFLEREVPLRVASLDLEIMALAEKLDSAVVRAPFAGSVYRTELKRGAMVRTGDPILRLADLERLRIRANVDQVDLGRVKPGQTMLIGSNAYPDREWRAEVAEVIPHVVIKESRAISESLALIEPPTEGLVPGMTVDLTILVDRSEDALQVPGEAVFALDGRSVVYRLAGQNVEIVDVEIGRSTVETVEISDGLTEGDRVVVGAAASLEDGARVKVRRTEPE